MPTTTLSSSTTPILRGHQTRPNLSRPSSLRARSFRHQIGPSMTGELAFFFFFPFLLKIFFCSTYNITGIPDISQNEHLMVWMRTAGLPNFRKLYAQTSGDLPAGSYTITVNSSMLQKRIGMWLTLAPFSLPRPKLFWHKVNSVFNNIVAWRQESLPRCCVHRRWHNLPPPRRGLPHPPCNQTPKAR